MVQKRSEATDSNRVINDGEISRFAPLLYLSTTQDLQRVLANDGHRFFQS
jgi:hypothetical protein